MNAVRRPMSAPPRTASRRGRAQAISLAASLMAVLLGVVLISGIASAHGPDPTFSGASWKPTQVVPYDWLTGATPPASMKVAIAAAAGDVSGSHDSKAASFSNVNGASSWIKYGTSICGDTVGLACFTRSGAPSSFTMSFRTQGYQFTWGKMNWCQLNATPWPDGCYDTEMAAVDEFGHVEILNHHANLADGSDYLDAAVQAVSHAKPGTGWNVHSLGKCDVAALQKFYDMLTPATDIGDCFGTTGLASTLTAVTNSTYACPVDPRPVMSGTLKVATNTAYGQLSADPLGSRPVQIQRSPAGANTFVTVYTPTTSATTGAWSQAVSASNGTYDFRAHFAKDHGAGADYSPIVTITFGSAC
jgi:hypothetical protein